MKPGEFQDIYELTPLQEAMLVQTVLAPETTAYHLQLDLELSGELDEEAFESTWAALVQRHSILRTSFVWEDLDRPYQVVHRDATLPLTRLDLRDMPAPERHERLESFIREDRSRAFDLLQAPLARAALIRLTDDVHRFILTTHHIILEGWSLAILIREAAQIYRGIVSGQRPELPPARPFADHVRCLRQQDQAKSELFWRERLRGLQSPTRLPVDRGSGSVSADVGVNERRSMALPEESTTALTAFARSNRLTLNTLLQGAWALLLNRYSGDSDVVFGTALSGRSGDLSEVDSMVGMFVNTLPTRVVVDDNEPLGVWLERFQRRQAEMTRYESSALRQVQSWSEVPGAEAMFENVFVLQNWSAHQSDGTWTGGLTVRSVSSGGGSDQPLTLNVVPGPRLRVTLVYDRDRFDAPTIERMLDQYRTILESMMADPSQPLSSVSMLKEDERRRLLVEWNDTSTAYPRDSSIAELFEEQIARHPEAVAVELEGRTLTYAELNRRANQVAHHLIRHGVGREVKVGVALERSLEMVVGILGVLKAGGAYVPLDPGYPKSRLAYMVEDTRTPVILTQAHLAADLPEHDGVVVRLDADRESIAKESGENPTSRPGAEDLAYVMYTSGSTGRPKGSCIVHRSVVRLVRETNFIDVRPEDVFLQFAPISFDASTLELWGPLLNGAKLVVFPPRTPSLKGLGESIESHGVTTLWLTGALFQQMVDARPRSFRKVRQLLAGGDALSAPHVRRVIEDLDGDRVLINGYGPTENTTFTCCHVMGAGSRFERSVPIGRPIANTRVYILDDRMEPVPIGAPGELYTGGDGLAREYLNDPALTAEKLVPDPFGSEAGSRLYRTGDRARYLPDGTIEFLDRIDYQVKVRGFRIELGEIETALIEHPAVREAVVLCREDEPGDKRLVAYLVRSDGREGGVDDVRGALIERLPDYMIPSAFVVTDAFPLTPSGKLDRRSLPAPSGKRQIEQAYVAPRSETEAKIAEIWRDLLKIDDVGIHDNFFDLGGHSLLLIRMHRRIQEDLGAELPMLDLFRHTTVRMIAARVTGDEETAPEFQAVRERLERRSASSGIERAVAVVGMSGRFPGARNVETFWDNLCNGIEAISFYSDEELRRAGVDEARLRLPNYVKAGMFLDDADMFDASFFGYTPRQAETIDPQQRLFLECAWQLLETAGYDPSRYAGAIGVYAGVAQSSYLSPATMDPELLRTIGALQALMGSDKDYLPTRVSYKLGLNGPSVNVQTACSTSLVATHLAVQALLNHDCDMAVAGGATIRFPLGTGYLYHEDGIASPDGHCRAFDARAKGTVGGNGVAVILVKRLEDALADGGPIHAVIRGSALNNDGADKIGYTAPSVDRQAEVIFAAQTRAGVDPGSITYVEAHGTGTPLGDPIEIEALTRAFRAGTRKSGFCALGSLKSNVGHLDAAAGVGGLIKTVLALKHRRIPPSLHYESPNPEIDFANSPFFVNTTLREWQADGVPLRAGVSSFGIGGTNAHVVLEEAPAVEPSDPAKPWQLLPLSARTSTALERATEELAAHLKAHPEINLADVAYTLQIGRKEFTHRRVVVCEDVSDAIEALESRDRRRVVNGVREASEAPVVFLFTGQGAQYPDMGLGLYRTEPVFRSEVDRCCEMLRAPLGLDLRALLYPPASDRGSAQDRLDRTEWTQPALFVIEYALARLWMSWGVRPSAMIGHSIGEYVAACLAGVMSLEDALGLVSERGRRMGELPGGSMLAVPLSEEELGRSLGGRLSIATLNGPSMSVVSGEDEAIAALATELRERGLEPRVLRTSHAFHSPMMDPIVEPFTKRVREVALKPPRIPYVSNVTGTWIAASEATDPGYWASHLRRPVRFSAGLETLFEDPSRVLLEVGPGHTLSTLARRHPSRPREQSVVSSLRHPTEERADEAVLLESVGRLWLAGVRPDWSGVHEGERRHRVVLPTYPFERQRYWIESKSTAKTERLGRKPDARDWLYVPSWKPAPLLVDEPDAAGSRWLLFKDASGLGDDLADLLTASGASVTRVTAGTTFDAPEVGHFAIDPDDPAHYRRVLDSLDRVGGVPARIVHLWSAGEAGEDADGDRTLTRGFCSILYLMQALDDAGVTEPLDVTVVTRGAHAVTGAEILRPSQASTLGPCKVMAQEFPHVRARSIDVDGALGTPGLAPQLARDLCGQRDDPVVAYRGGRRWVQDFDTYRVDIPATDRVPAKLRKHGVYVITGGLGGVGLELASWLARSVQAKLVLVGRSGLAPGALDDAVERRRVALVQTLEAAGAEVLVCRADVTDAAEMRDVFAAAEQRFGAVHGVIHAAGADAARTPLRTAGRAACERVLAPKLGGLSVLAEVLAGRDLDFCLVHSSLSSVMGAMEMSAYVAAHLFMDTFVHRQDRTSATPWMTVNWETWRTWRTEDVTYPAGIAEFLMERPEFGNALARVLSLDGATQLLVSTGDVQARIDRWTRRDGADDASSDRAAEAAVHYPRPALETDYVAPRNETEERLVELWQAALGIERVGVYDNLLDLGADSVVVIQIGARAKDLGIELTPKQIFSHPTIAELAAMVSGAAAAAAAVDTIAEDDLRLVAVARDGTLPLSFAQQRLWFLDQLGMGSSYNIPQAFRLSGRLDETALSRAIDEIVRRHEVLRTTYATVDGEPVQQVQAHTSNLLAQVDLRGADEHERQAELERRLREAARVPFNLAEGPLLHATLLRLDDDEHVLVLVMHHIVTDGWSMGVLFRELDALYDAFRNGKASPLPELEIQYADYAAWQRRWLSGPVLERHVSYWREKLADLTALELPTDRPRAANPEFRGDALPFRLDRELTRGLHTLSRDHGCTLAMTLSAAFQVLMSRYAGQGDVVIGTPIANRNRPELENLIGFFVNSLVLRTDLAGDPSFAEALRRVQATSIDAYEHADLPFEQLVDELDIPRDLSRNPLFQVTFGLQNAMGDEPTLSGLELQRVRMGVMTSRFDLEVHAYEGAEGLSGVWLYDTDLFDRATVERMSRHFRTLLLGIVGDPKQRLSRTPLLSDEERQQLIVGWNDTDVDVPDRWVHGGFENQAASTPHGVAVAFGETRLTYEDLDRRSNQLAHHLRGVGVRRGTTVGICMERSEKVTLSMLAVLKAGGVYVPLDTEQPARRQRFILEDCDATVVLTSNGTLHQTDMEIPVICLGANAAAIDAQSARRLEGAIEAEDLAYVLYTSGSTGRPKGVCVPHGALANHMAWMERLFPLGPEDRVLQKTQPTFDASVWEFYAPLLVGATLVVAGPDAHRDPSLLVEEVLRHRITTLQVVPMMLQALVEEPAFERCDTLRRVFSGGEALSGELVARFGKRLAASLCNLYGPTEATIDATFHCCPTDEVLAIVPIGRPIDNVRAYVLDEHLEPLPVGVAGELLLGGTALARGYVNDPALTAERFIPDPFGGEPGRRLYRTGDLARWLADGSIEFRGRVDQQVKIRGFRIELGEIESVLREHPTIGDAAAVLWGDDDESKRIAAYVVPADDTEETVAGDATRAAIEEEHVTEWHALHELTYEQPTDRHEDTFNIAGWESSYTGEPIPPEEMDEWVEETVARIRSCRPTRVLEIGCGSGLLLHRLAPECERYVGTDYSETVLRQVEAAVAARGLDQVELMARMADDFSGIEPGSFDTVVVNSVAQYLPSADYLVRVMQGAAAALAPGGRIFVGDVRNLALLQTFHATVELHRADDGLSTVDLEREIRARTDLEGELVLAPAFFWALREILPRIGRVQVLLKHGRHHNELTQFRYDAILHLDPQNPERSIERWLDWQEPGLSLEEIARTLETGVHAIGLTRMPNARVRRASLLLAALADEDRPERVDDLRRSIDAAPPGVDPAALRALALEHGYALELSDSHSGDRGMMDAVLWRPQGPDEGLGSAPAFPAPSILSPPRWRDYANSPLRGRMARYLVPQLRTFIGERLPDYMMPATFLVLESLPQTSSGKLDRRALPAPDRLRSEAAGDYVAPRTDTEERVAGIWSDVLHLERVGIHDNFFELGGHSLLATQVIARIREEFQVELSVRSVFEHPRVAELAELIASRDTTPEQLPLVPVPRTEPLPLSSAQQRLWFLDRLGVGAAYNMPQAVQLRGPLDVAALEGALADIVQRHEVLRTVFPSESGKPRQTVPPEVELALAHADLTALPEGEREQEAARLVAEDAATPFDLSRGPLLRATLIRLGAEEHVLVVTVHHIACDGWSFAVLDRELSQGYTARVQDRTPELPDLPIQYADYAHWQRAQLASDASEAQLEYWREHLGGAPRSIELPTDRPRPAVQTYDGAIHDVALSSDLAGSLRELSREHDATLAITMLAAFDTLMSRYTGQDDIVVGSPIANRGRLELEQLIGFFVNTVAIRADLSGDPTFAELLRRVRHATLDAHEHQDVPFEQLVDELDPVRDPSRSPLFQVVFSMQNTPGSPLAFEGLMVRPFGSKAATVRYDLECHIWELENEIVGRFVYNTDLFDEATIVRMATHFRTLLEGIAADPTTPISKLPLLGEEERRRVLSAGAGEARSYSADVRVHERFEARAATSPAATALTFEDRSLTYGALNARANRLAHSLRARGVGPEVLVGVCVERSLDLVVAILAVLKAGGAYVPLDPDYPKQRLSFILGDARTKLLLTQSHLAGDLPDDGGEVVCLDATSADLERQPEANPEPLGSPSDPAYVIYTSGSTGTPKGVVVQHDNLSRLFHATEAWYGFDGSDVWTLFHSSAFDFSVWEIWGALLYGGRLVVVPYETSRSPEDFHALVLREGVTVLNQTPSAFRQFIHANATSEGGADLALRYVIFGGEALELESLRPWFERHGDVRPQLVNMYGITETTVHVTYRPLGMADLSEAPGSVIGRPIPDLRVLVLDAHGQPCPVGVPGEMYVGGAGVARGYLWRPGLTAERFVSDRYSEEAGARLYRTGDVARVLANGDLEYLGRNDEQVKVRGFRIELGEIEAALLRDERVREAVAMVREDDPGTKRIVAYVVTDGDATGLVSELRASLAEQLPQYMVPAAFVPIPSVPLTAHGKVDRRALPAPTGERWSAEDAYVAPRTAEESTLAGIWSDLLRVERVGVHDNFFELGGDSILSIQIIARARQEGLHLTPRQMFQHQTVAELAAVAETASESSIAAEQGAVVGDVPLTPIQHWFFEQERLDPHHYNQAILLSVHERIDPAVMQRAVNALLTHHDALRSRFTRTDAGWTQVVLEPGGDAPFERVDLSALDEDGQRAAITKRAEELQASLVLDDGALVRAAQFDLGPDRPGRVLVVVHHLAVDGVSWRILREDLQRACEQLTRGERVELPPKTTSYRKWAERLAAHARSRQVQNEIESWLGQPWDRSGVIPVAGDLERNTVGRAERRVVRLDEAETRTLLGEVPRAYNTQIDDVLLTALAQAFAPWTGKDCLLVDLESHGREDVFEDVDLSRTVGWFTSIYPVLVDVGGADGRPLPSGAALKSMKEQLRRVPHRGIGHGLLRYLGDDPRLATLPRPSVSFNYLGQLDQLVEEDSLFALASEPAGALHSPRDRRKHQIEVDGAVIGGRLHMSFTYGSEVHDAAAVEALAGRFRTSLVAIVDHCTAPGAGGHTPSDFPLAQADQRTLDRLAKRYGADAIEDLYPLSPMQSGMLFHSQHDPSAGIYVEQFRFRVETLDPGTFRRAWQAIVDRHAVLRTSIVEVGSDRPLQLVHRRCELPFTEHDCRSFSEDDQARWLERFVREDRERGIDLEAPPPMRIALIRLEDDRYELIWTFHHIMLDGWSFPLVFNEVLKVYEAERRGETPVLPRIRPYRDHIAWLERQDDDEANAYWRRTLEGFTTPTTLFGIPSQRGTESYAFEDGWLTAERTASLQAMASREQVTLNTLVVGAWALLLSRYSGERDVVLGTISSGRPPDLEGVESMVGLFVNTLPLRVKVAADRPLAEWLREIQALQSELRRYEHSALWQVQQHADLPAGTPLFESLYVFENYPVDLSAVRASDMTLRMVPTESRSGYPLALRVGVTDKVGMRVTYDSDRFDAEAMRCFVDHLVVLLESFADDPERRVGDVPMLGVAETRQILVEWNATSRPRPDEQSVHRLFEKRARQVPDATAVVFEDASWTYGELNARANRVARYLRRHGVGPETIVGLCVERGFDLVVGMLGILKAGGAFLGLDAEQPSARLAYLVDDARPAVLLTQRGLGALLPPGGGPVLCLDADGSKIESEPDSDLADGVTAEKPAYVIYTSGSTGKPKGVVVTHRAVANFLAWSQRVFPLGADDGVLAKTMYTFDNAVWEVLAPLLAGARSVLAEHGGHRDPGHLIELMRRHRVTALKLVPSLLDLLVEHGGLDECTALRFVLCGGEPLTAELADRARAQLHATLHNNYGSTETTIDATADLDPDGTSDPIGRPIDNVRTYVLDESMRPVPAGVVGELYVGGAGLARGYLNDPALTATKFVPDPFDVEDGARLYGTGDRCRYAADGKLEFVGRADHQVNVRGFRVELGEIEAILQDHASVQDAVVTLQRMGAGDDRLVAYVVPDGVASEGELGRFAAERLPEYMVPSVIVTLEELPLTSSGKVDRKALPAPAATRQVEDEYVAPRSGLEEQIAAIWREVLRLDAVGVHDNFFRLGGHSLLATQVVSRVRSLLAAELPLREFFDRPTVAELAACLGAGKPEVAGREGIVAVSRDGELPLSFAQQRMWFLDQMGTAAAYNLSISLRLDGDLDTGALEGAIHAIVERHEVLRTVFPAVDGAPAQRILPALRIPITAVDLRDLEPSDRERELIGHQEHDALTPFDLASGPLIRAKLLRLEDRAHALLLTMHHIVFDGWSAGVFMRELLAHYRALTTGEPVGLGELPIQYADFSQWQRAWMQGEEFERQLVYWRQTLADVAVLQLPTDRPRPAVQTFDGAKHGFQVPLDLRRGLAAVGRDCGATLAMTLLAAYQVLLSRYASQDEVVVGTPIANRNRHETENLIGFFVNTLAMRADLSGDPTFMALLGRVKEVALGAYEHQDVPFERLVEELQPERDLSQNPIFQTLFIMQNAPRETQPLERLTTVPLRPAAKTARFDMELLAGEFDDGIAFELVYNTDLFDAATIERMATHFRTLLEGIAAEPATPISKLPLLGAEERRRVLSAGAGEARSYPSDVRVHERFEARAAGSPDATALTAEDRGLTYGALNARANRLAHFLRARGVGPEVLVGVCIERSLDLVVAILGVLKAGGAYVPLDPDYPKQRLSFILGDARTKLLLTQSDLAGDLPDAGGEVVCLDATSGDLDRQPETNPAPLGSPSDPAYVIYTSGSTGTPKGVVVQHDNLSRLFDATEAWYGFDGSDVWTLFHSSAFDFSVWEIWGALLYGGRLVVVPYETSRSPEEFHALVLREGVTVLNQTPSAFRQFIHANASSEGGADLALRYVIFGGEALELESLRPWFERHGDVRPQLVNMYGITETTVHVTYRPLGMADLSEAPGSVIGRPIPDLRVLVLDAHGQPCPVGVPGEMYVGGAGVARGYLWRPGLTAERFVSDRYSEEAGARLYRTGDVARVLANGDLEYLGRNDEQVKVRGFRIELGEIEAALLRDERVREAVAMVREDDPGTKRIVAYVVTDGDAAGVVSELRASLAEQLPQYMVPAAFVPIASVPLTAHGKVDRRALPAPTGERWSAEDAYVAPRTEAESTLAAIWSELLRVERVGVHDNFFHLGGHSLLATQVVSRIRSAFEIDLPLRRVFELPTVAELADEVEHVGWLAGHHPVAPHMGGGSEEGTI